MRFQAASAIYRLRRKREAPSGVYAGVRPSSRPWTRRPPPCEAVRPHYPVSSHRFPLSVPPRTNLGSSAYLCLAPRVTGHWRKLRALWSLANLNLHCMVACAMAALTYGWLATLSGPGPNRAFRVAAVSPVAVMVHDNVQCTSIKRSLHTS